MLIVETIAKIRRSDFVQQRSIRSICRDFGLSRKVVRKVLRSDATDFKYEREHQPRPGIDCWRADLDRILDDWPAAGFVDISFRLSRPLLRTPSG